MKKIIDMHVHSTYSDGTNTPLQLAKIAKNAGLCAFALTDHDSTDGLAEISSLSRQFDIKIIPGVELSTGYLNLEQDVHILGYNIDYNSPTFKNHLKNFQQERVWRNKKMAQNLADDGIDISYEKLLEIYPDSVITRAHFARYLMNKGYVSSVREGISNFLSKDSKYYVKRTLISPTDAVNIIKEAGGKSVLAHPLLYGLDDAQLNDLIQKLCEMGLDGIEAIYSLHSSEDEKYVMELAKKYNLKISGGSDYHGTNKPDISIGSGKGNLKIPYELLEQLEIT